ncbi:MAG: LytR C-terminal domain-containing protein [Acidimicrobiales bacterium]
MSERQRPGGESAPSTPTGTGGTAVRGALLIGAAVALGVLLLAKGVDTGFVPTSDNDRPQSGIDQGDGGDNGTTNGDGTTDTEPTADTRPPAEVRVWALNGSTINGAAGNATQTVTNTGYQIVSPSDAPENVEASIVFFIEGFQADAAAVAGLLGIPAERVTALPDPPPVPNGDIRGANVIVVIGPDFGQ